MSKIELRLKKYLDANKIKVSEVERNANLSNGSVGKHFKEDTNGLSSSSLDKILRCYPDINSDWLFSGIGNMSNSHDAENNTHSNESDSWYQSKFMGGNYSDLFTHYPSICITDGENLIITLNDTFIHQTGYALADSIGKHTDDLLIPNESAESKIRSKLSSKRDARVSFYEEFTCVHSKGFEMVCKAFFFPVMHEGKLDQYVCFANFVPAPNK